MGLKINEKQKRFADFYVESLNAEQSAIKAGYSEKYARGNAHKLVANSCIKEYIQERNKKLESDRIANIKEVKEFWTKVLRSNAYEIKDRLKASEFIAKSNGLFIDKVEMSGEINNPLAGLTTEELKKLIKNG